MAMTRGYRMPDRSACDMFTMYFPQEDTSECVCRYVTKDGRRFNTTSGRFGLHEVANGHQRGQRLAEFLERKALEALNQAIRAHNAVVGPYPND